MDNDNEKFVNNHSWMVRPCSLYEEEYSDCRSIRSRFHQYFVDGHYSDCTQWRKDFDNCTKWKEDHNTNAFRELIESEKQRRIERLSAHLTNDVWEARKEPPSDWNAPLPEWLQRRDATSFLAVKASEEKVRTPKSENRTFCVLS